MCNERNANLTYLLLRHSVDFQVIDMLLLSVEKRVVSAEVAVSTRDRVSSKLGFPFVFVRVDDHESASPKHPPTV
jgi:hypothetical protein